MEAEIGVAQLQATDPGLLANTAAKKKGWNRFLPRAFREDDYADTLKSAL